MTRILQALKNSGDHSLPLLQVCIFNGMLDIFGEKYNYSILMIKLLILNAINNSFEMLQRDLITGMIILNILHPNKLYKYMR